MAVVSVTTAVVAAETSPLSLHGSKLIEGGDHELSRFIRSLLAAAAVAAAFGDNHSSCLSLVDAFVDCTDVVFNVAEMKLTMHAVS